MNTYDLSKELSKKMRKQESRIECLVKNADSSLRLAYYKWALVMLQEYNKDLTQTIIDFNMENK